MPRMIFDLTDQDRDALEDYRASAGLRSGAEALRALIRSAADREQRTVREITEQLQRLHESREPRFALDLPLGPQPAAPGSRLKGAKR